MSLALFSPLIHPSDTHIHTQRLVPLGVAERGAHVLPMTHLCHTICHHRGEMCGVVCLTPSSLTQTPKLSHFHKNI